MSTARSRKRASDAPSPEKQAAGALAKARDRLGDAIVELTWPHRVPTEQGPKWIDSPYDQLRDAIHGPNTPGHGTLAASLPPLWVDAHDTLTNIERRVATWEPRPILVVACNECGTVPDAPQTVLKLRALNARKWRPQDERRVIDYAGEIENWAAEIAYLFDPKPKYLPDPCPRCDKSVAYHANSSGEDIRSPALQITMKGCTCRNCGKFWAPNELPFLGRMLGYPAPAGVIET